MFYFAHLLDSRHRSCVWFLTVSICCVHRHEQNGAITRPVQVRRDEKNAAECCILSVRHMMGQRSRNVVYSYELWTKTRECPFTPGTHTFSPTVNTPFSLGKGLPGIRGGSLLTYILNSWKPFDCCYALMALICETALQPRQYFFLILKSCTSTWKNEECHMQVVINNAYLIIQGEQA